MFSALHSRDFRLLWVATLLSNLAQPAQFITLTFWAQDEYHDQRVLVTGLIVGVRGVGMLVFSLIGGVIADRFERRKVLLCCEAVAVCLTGLLAFCMIRMPLGDETVLAVLVVVFLFAANMAIDGPSRSASIPVIVPPEILGRAIGLNNVAQQLTFPIVIPLIGFLAGRVGPGGVVGLSMFAWVLVLPLVASLRYSSLGFVRVRRKASDFFGDVRAGLAYTVRDSTILGVICLLLVMQVVGMPGVGMLGPVWMTEVLGLSRAQFGILALFWGAGAVTSGFLFALRPELPRRGLTLGACIILFGVCGIIFGHSRIVLLTGFANFGLGFAMGGAMVTSITIAQYAVVEEMRGRVMGLFPLVMGFSMLAVTPVGAAGQAWGLPVVVPTLEWAALALGALILFATPGLRKVRSQPLVTPAGAAAG